jgi:hypothetical protein
LKYFCLIFWLICLGCREYYEPPVLKHNPNFLVVDGFLTSSPDSTQFRLTYTRNLSDTALPIPALHANMLVEGDQNTVISLNETGNGIYSNLLFLKTSEKYRLTITTSDGARYQSDFVPFKQTPAIDSISWKEDTSKVSFYINTHDPQNDTRYYRWQFEETWQYSTYLNSNFDFINGQLVERTPDQQIHNCWSTSKPSIILLSSTSQLSQDVVNQFYFNSVPKTTEKIFIEYSVLVRQYALTQDEFAYWTELKKSSEQLGTLFDNQPSQLSSNIHCLSDPTQPVMGYLSASSVEQKRIFVSYYQLSSWNYEPYYLPCHVLKDVTTGFSPNDSSRAYDYLERPDHLFTFWYYDVVYHVAENFCIDCREHGGTNVKPSFWP